MSAIARIYAEGGIAAFWVGNGLSVAKIFPESAIKFLTYEASVRPVSYTLRGGSSTRPEEDCVVVYRNVSLPVMWTTLKTSAISAERVASCREALVASRANLASVSLS